MQGGADHRPTDSSVEVLQMIERDLAAAQAGFDTLVQKTVPAFNKANAEAGDHSATDVGART